MEEKNFVDRKWVEETVRQMLLLMAKYESLTDHQKTTTNRIYDICQSLAEKAYNRSDSLNRIERINLHLRALYSEARRYQRITNTSDIGIATDWLLNKKTRSPDLTCFFRPPESIV